jgi:nitroreductase
MVGGGNIRRVLEAPASVVWLADLEPWKLVDKMIAMERASGRASELELENLRADAAFMVGSAAATPPASWSQAQARAQTQEQAQGHAHAQAQTGGVLRLLLDARAQEATGAATGAATALETTAKRALLSMLSHVTQAPTINSSTEAWAFKSTMLAVQTMLFGMSSQGYDCAPMEGFDARRVKAVVGASEERYSVPIVVATGKASSSSAEEGQQQQQQQSPRFAFEEIFSRDSLDFPLHRT